MTRRPHTNGVFGDITGDPLRAEQIFGEMFFISKEYLTVGEEQEVSGVAGRSFGEGFQWWKTRTRCGVVIQEVTPRVAGDWLCHLADTSSQQDSVRDERLIRVLIASRAVIRLSLEVNGETEVNEAAVGSLVKISCISGEDLSMNCTFYLSK